MSNYDSKRNYWIKLKTSLLTSEKVDFLMRQKDGAWYVVLYQCLCLKLCNNNGILGVPLSDEIIVPYNCEKIFGETKGWFTIDTIRVALELYKQLGLIYLEENGLYRITDFESLIGSETNAAERMRITRAKNNERTISEQSANNVHKILDNRDKILDNKILDNKETTNNKESIGIEGGDFGDIDIEKLPF